MLFTCSPPREPQGGCPPDMGYYHPVDFVNGAKSLTRVQKDAIIGGNAARLLKIKSRLRI